MTGRWCWLPKRTHLVPLDQGKSTYVTMCSKLKFCIRWETGNIRYLPLLCQPRQQQVLTHIAWAPSPFCRSLPGLYGHIEEPQFCRTQVSEDKREQAPVIEDQELQIRQPRQVLRSESWMAKLRASRWGKSRVSSSFLLIIIENEMMATSTTQVPVFKACKCTSGKCPPSWWL